MSRPKYLSNDQSPLSIIIVEEELIQYLFTITNNQKQFPKAYRYTLVAEIRNTALKMYKATYKAIVIKPRYVEQMDQKLKYQQKVYNRIIELRSLLIIAAGIVQIANIEHLSKLIDKLIEAHEAWVKTDKRTYKKLPSYEEYVMRKRYYNERRRQKALEWKALDRDEDGFVVLKKKAPGSEDVQDVTGNETK